MTNNPVEKCDRDENSSQKKICRWQTYKRRSTLVVQREIQIKAKLKVTLSFSPKCKVIIHTL